MKPLSEEFAPGDELPDPPVVPPHNAAGYASVSPRSAFGVPLPESPAQSGRGTLPEHLDRAHTPVNSAALTGERSITPGMWSTAATPGIDDPYSTPGSGIGGSSRLPTVPSVLPQRPTLLAPRPNDDDSWSTATNDPLSRQNSWRPDLPNVPLDNSPGTGIHSLPSAPALPPSTIVSPGSGESNDSMSTVKRVHFSPSVVGGSEASTSPAYSAIDLPGVNDHPPLPPSQSVDLPGAPTFTPSAPPPPPTHYAPIPPASAPPIAPHPANSYYQYHHTAPSAPPLPPPPIVVAPPPPPPPAVLTTQLIATVQKHCKFAISALDYEDAETARKQLRLALATLGG